MKLVAGPPAAFTRNEFQLAVDRPHDQRLDDAVLLDGLRELVELLAGDVGAWLQRARDDRVQGNMPDGVAVGSGWFGPGSRFLNEGTEPLPQRVLRHTGRAYAITSAEIKTDFSLPPGNQPGEIPVLTRHAL